MFKENKYKRKHFSLLPPADQGIIQRTQRHYRAAKVENEQGNSRTPSSNPTELVTNLSLTRGFVEIPCSDFGSQVGYHITVQFETGKTQIGAKKVKNKRRNQINVDPARLSYKEYATLCGTICNTSIV